MWIRVVIGVADTLQTRARHLASHLSPRVSRSRVVTMSFAELTAVHRDDTDRFAIDVDESSFIVRGPNGGYIAAVLLRALTARIADDGVANRAPRSLTVHYPSPPAAGP